MISAFPGWFELLVEIMYLYEVPTDVINSYIYSVVVSPRWAFDLWPLCSFAPHSHTLQHRLGYLLNDQ